ncbi:phosphate acyltransferase [Erysipelotrichaceae bacterium]|nr:phosphate acyltransferase [Erysipelotrichaceae bacterium]
MYKIAVDVMGSDDAPVCELSGIKLALEELTHIKVIAFGKKEEIEAYGLKHERLEYVYTDDKIIGTDDATTAFRLKKSASMIMAIQAVKDKKADAVVSAGNTGAYITAGLFMLGRIKGIRRPALATLFPTATKGKYFVFADLGAVVDATPEILNQTGIVGTQLAKIMLNIEHPKVGLLNIGEEDKKGTTLYVETNKLLRENHKVDFIGNIEPRYIMDGRANVIVADGFTGNIALKSYEGMQQTITTVLKREIMKSFGTKIGGLLIKPALKELKATLDYEGIGGAVLAGVKSPLIKAHGTTTSFQFSSAIKIATTFLEKDLVGEITKVLEKDTDK